MLKVLTLGQYINEQNRVTKLLLTLQDTRDIKDADRQMFFVRNMRLNSMTDEEHPGLPVNYVTTYIVKLCDFVKWAFRNKPSTRRTVSQETCHHRLVSLAQGCRSPTMRP